MFLANHAPIIKKIQTWNKTRLCDSKARTQELGTRTRDVQDKHENNVYFANICKHEHEKNMIRL